MIKVVRASLEMIARTKSAYILNFYSVALSVSVSETASYDWYQSYATLRHLLDTQTLATTGAAGFSVSRNQDGSETILKSASSARFFPSYDECRVLILGCGNSNFGDHMREDGWKGEIVNVDFSAVVIDQMKTREELRYSRRSNQTMKPPKLRYICADVTRPLPFEDGSFDLIICKGTFDAVLCSNVGATNAKRLVAECSRVLAGGHGCLFLCSYGTPDNRVVFLEHDNDLSYYWQEVSIHTVQRKKSGRKGGSKYVFVA
jgi:SAM-dependent methyltransferase